METPTELAEAAGISVPFASQLLSGKRNPSLSVALQIYERTGKRFGLLAQATDDEIASLKRLQEAA